MDREVPAGVVKTIWVNYVDAGVSADTLSMGMDAFQEAPQMKMVRPITKWNHRVPSPGKAAWAVNRAFSLSCNGRPGLVMV